MLPKNYRFQHCSYSRFTCVQAMAAFVLTALRTCIALSPPDLRWDAPRAWWDIAFLAAKLTCYWTPVVIFGGECLWSYLY